MIGLPSLGLGLGLGLGMTPPNPFVFPDEVRREVRNIQKEASFLFNNPLFSHPKGLILLRLVLLQMELRIRSKRVVGDEVATPVAAGLVQQRLVVYIQR